MLSVRQAILKAENGFPATHKWIAFLLVIPRCSARLLEGKKPMPKGLGAEVGHRFLIRLSNLILEDLLHRPGTLTFLSNCEASPHPHLHHPPKDGSQLSIFMKGKQWLRAQLYEKRMLPTFHLYK